MNLRDFSHVSPTSSMGKLNRAYKSQPPEGSSPKNGTPSNNQKADWASQISTKPPKPFNYPFSLEASHRSPKLQTNRPAGWFQHYNYSHMHSKVRAKDLTNFTPHIQNNYDLATAYGSDNGKLLGPSIMHMACTHQDIHPTIPT
jgi:hypothetical protein